MQTLTWTKQGEDDPWSRIGDPYESDSHTGDQDGKYLFFSTDKELLMSIMEHEILAWGFQYAKVIDVPKGDDYVACLYWVNGLRKEELARRYKNVPKLKYRGYKTNAATRAGIYSKQFLSQGGYRGY